MTWRGRGVPLHKQHEIIDVIVEELDEAAVTVTPPKALMVHGHHQIPLRSQVGCEIVVPEAVGMLPKAMQHEDNPRRWRSHWGPLSGVQPQSLFVLEPASGVFRCRDYPGPVCRRGPLLQGGAGHCQQEGQA